MTGLRTLATARALGATSAFSRLPLRPRTDPRLLELMGSGRIDPVGLYAAYRDGYATATAGLAVYGDGYPVHALWGDVSWMSPDDADAAAAELAVWTR